MNFLGGALELKWFIIVVGGGRVSYYFDNTSKTSKLLFVYENKREDIASDKAAITIYRAPFLHESQIFWSFLLRTPFKKLMAKS